MRTTIDAAGRLVIPKDIRDALGLRGGERLDVRAVDGIIELEPAATPVRLEERNGRLVAVAEEPMPTLTAAAVRELMECLRR